MATPPVESVASFSAIEEVSTKLRRESRFFVGNERSEIQILTDLLEDLNSFLEGADAESAEKLMRESVNGWLEQTKDATEFKGRVEDDCLLKLSKVLQQRRIVNFFGKANERFTKLDAIRDKSHFETRKFKVDSEEETIYGEDQSSEVQGLGDEVIEVEGLTSYPDIEVVSSMLKRELVFFIGIQSSMDALNNLDDFLVGADAKSVEKLAREFARSLLEETEPDQAAVFCVDDCLANMSKILAHSQIIDFFSRAGQWYSKLDAPRAQNLHYSFVDEYADSDSKDVVAWLTKEAPNRSILSFVPSLSCIGKLTDHQRLNYSIMTVQDHFDCCYWINVLGLYKIENLLEIMEKQNDRQLGTVLHAKREMKLIEKLLRHSIQRNRYMFVFDDVCHEEFWDVIKQALLDDDKRNRIILTNPSDEDKVFSSFRKGSFKKLVMLGPLSEPLAWKLFCEIAFQDEPKQCCPIELRQLSEEIVNMCKGFPLPIVGIAGLLSKRDKQVLEWRKVCDSFKLEVKTNPISARVLDVSLFSLLPDHLRPCLLYFSMFPKNYAIPYDMLFKSWIAEGFIKENSGKTLEETAEEYLNELIQSNFVQPCQGLNRLDQFCRVESSVHSFIVFKAESADFCRLIVDIGFYHKILVDEMDFDDELRSFHGMNCHRLSIFNSRLSLLSISQRIYSKIHSLFYFGDDLDIFILGELIRVGELTVLVFGNCSISRLPGELGELVHLKYLSLKNTKVTVLPTSIAKLINLQTLDLRGNLISMLPTEINRLKNLQHLLASICDDGISGNPTRGVRVIKGIGSLKNLQTLTMVDAFHSGVGVIKELAALHQLRIVGISGLTAEIATALCTCIDKFSLLKSLTLHAFNGNEVLNLKNISSELPILQRLVLKGRFQNLPHWIFGLHALSTLCLSLTQLNEDQMVLLSHLPNLVSLWLCRAYKGKQLYFKKGSFGKLKLLVLRELHQLNVLKIEEGALPCLEELRIGSSLFLVEVPSGIRFLTNLKLFVNYDMSKEFVVRMQPDGGLDYWKVEHIPSVLFLCRVEQRKYKLFELGDSGLLDHLLGLPTNCHQITEPQHEHEFIFCESDGEEDDDYVGQLSVPKAKSNFFKRNFKQSSFTSSFFSDDVEQ